MEQVTRYRTETGRTRYCEACGDSVLMERTELARGMRTSLASRAVKSPSGQRNTDVKKTGKSL